MPRWILPTVIVGDLVVVAVLYAVLGWPALVVGAPLVVGSIVVTLVLSLTSSRGPVPRPVGSSVRASGHSRVTAGPFRSTGYGDDDPFSWTHGHAPGWHHDHTTPGWSDHHGGHVAHDPGCATSWDTGPSSSDPGCSSWSDSGSSSSDSSSSDSGSSSSSSD